MKYKSGQRRRALEYEKAVLEFWKKDKTFEKSVDNRDAKRSYVFYDGPPFITGNPHHGTLLSSIVKDAVPRFWTMNGYRVERRWGWDCHGLPAENFVEKQLGITDRREIGTKWLKNILSRRVNRWLRTLKLGVQQLIVLAAGLILIIVIAP